MLDDQADTAADPELRRCGGGHRQGAEEIVRAQVLAGKLGATRPRAAAAHRDVGVLWKEQRLEAALLGGAGEFAWMHRLVGRELDQSEIHGALLVP